MLRNIAKDLVESVECIDTFEKGGRVSKCYRVIYRHMDKSLTNDEAGVFQTQLREAVSSQLKCELR